MESYYHYRNQSHINHSPQYQRFKDRDEQTQPANKYYEDNRSNDDNQRGRGRYNYNPPNAYDVYDDYDETTASPTYRSFIADDRDFYEVGKAILLELDEATNSTTNDREKSVATALQLHKMLSIKELNDFNNALSSRIKGIHYNQSQIDMFTHTCERTFGKELRMLILQKGSISPFSKASTKQSETSSNFVEQPFSEKFHKSPESNNSIDLTDHIIYDEDTQKSPSSSFYEGNFPTLTSVRTSSNTDNNDDDSEIYTIELMDIKKKKSFPTSNRQSSLKNKRSPSKVRFDSKTQETSKRDKKNADSTSSKKRYQAAGMRESVQVVAPATLPENFMFEARIGDEIFMVVVVSFLILQDWPFI